MGDRLHQPGVRDLLARYPTLTALRAASQSRIERAIRARSPRIAAKVTAAIAAALAAQDVTVPAEAATGRVIAELAGELDRVCARRDALAAEIEEAFLAHPSGELLASMPGIGPRTGARILAEIGDGSAFANGSKLAAYAGLAPVTRQSGKSLNGESRSRRGNHRLKNAMFLAAFASLRDPASKAFYDRKRAEGKRHNAALICLARRRCDVILAMLRTGQPYRLTRPAPALAEAASPHRGDWCGRPGTARTGTHPFEIRRLRTTGSASSPECFPDRPRRRPGDGRSNLPVRSRRRWWRCRRFMICRAGTRWRRCAAISGGRWPTGRRWIMRASIRPR